MNNINIFRNYLAIVLLSVAVFSCKSDNSTTTETTASNKENMDSQIVKTTGNSSVNDKLQMKAEAKLKADGKEVTPEAIQEVVDELSAMPKIERLPNACDLISESNVASIFKKEATDVKSANGKRAKSGTQNSSSCFYRWSAGGILVQVSKNPLPDEIKNWSTKYIESKKSSGETSIDENGKMEKFFYKDFNGPGKFNVFNKENSRYISTYEEKYIITLNFNGNNRREKSLASEVMNEVFSNLD